MIDVAPGIHIDEQEIELSPARASGPGGQHLNKSETAVELRFDARHSPSLPDDVRHRLYRIAGSRLTQDGVIVILAQEFREQLRNRQAAIARLVELIRRAAEKPKPRKKTKPTRASQARRLEGKARRSNVKSGRSRPSFD